MKTRKIKKHTIYSVLNCGSGDIFYINWKPNKKEIEDLCCREFCWDKGSFEEHDYLIVKIDIFEKYE